MGNACSRNAVEIREVRPVAVKSRFRSLPPVSKAPVFITKLTSWTPDIVTDVLREISSDEAVHHEYIAVPGLPEFTSAATRLIFGENCSDNLEKKIGCFQTIGLTGAIRLGAEFLHRQLRQNTVLLPRASTDNYHEVFEAASFSEILYYRNSLSYGHSRSGGKDFVETLKSFPEDSVVVLEIDTLTRPLHSTVESGALEEMVDIMRERRLFPFLTAGRLGLVSGSVDRDARLIRLFKDSGVEMFVGVSLSRQFGILDDSVGCLFVVTSQRGAWLAVSSHLIYLAAPLWGNPPQHGALVVERILNDPAKREKWGKELDTFVQHNNQEEEVVFDTPRG